LAEEGCVTYPCYIVREGGLFGTRFPDLPEIQTVGKTRDEAIAMAGEALNAALATDVGRGFSLPESSPRMRGMVGIEVEAHILLACQLRTLRGERSQAEIARRLGLSYQAYQRLENPARGNPTIKTLERVAKAFGKKLAVEIA